MGRTPPSKPKAAPQKPPLKEQIISRSRKPATTPEKEREKKAPLDSDHFVSSGSTLLNLALTGHPNFGWQLGKMANIIGDSGAGKTQLALTAFAEASYNPVYNNMRLRYDDAENALEFDLGEVFGPKTEKRVEVLDPPSDNIEQFSDNLALTIRDNVPFIYVLDSFDAIGSEADTEHIESERKIRLGESKKDSKGSYGMAKPKLASQLLREECGKLKRTKGALLIVSQTRDNLTPGSFEKKTRSGGRALKFYATHEVWVILTGQITHPKTKLRIGAECDVKVTKNKVTGKRRTVSFNVYDGYGVDDIGSMIDFMLDMDAWTGGGKSNIDTKGDLGLKEAISRAKLIDLLETEEDRLAEMKDIVAEEWNEREKEVQPDRKKRYE